MLIAACLPMVAREAATLQLPFFRLNMHRKVERMDVAIAWAVTVVTFTTNLVYADATRLGRRAPPTRADTQLTIRPAVATGTRSASASRSRARGSRGRARRTLRCATTTGRRGAARRERR